LTEIAKCAGVVAQAGILRVTYSVRVDWRGKSSAQVFFFGTMFCFDDLCGCLEIGQRLFLQLLGQGLSESRANQGPTYTLGGGGGGVYALQRAHVDVLAHIQKQLFQLGRAQDNILHADTRRHVHDRLGHSTDRCGGRGAARMLAVDELAVHGAGRSRPKLDEKSPSSERALPP
jgi:hypothetical protein